MAIYSVGPLQNTECVLWLARKSSLWNNSHALRIRLGIDVVFYIFKVSHNHALFRFRLSLGPDTPCWALLGEEWKPKIICTRVTGGPGIPALSRPQTAQDCPVQTGILINLFISLIPFELCYVTTAILDVGCSMVKTQQIRSQTRSLTSWCLCSRWQGQVISTKHSNKIVSDSEKECKWEIWVMG